MARVIEKLRPTIWSMPVMKTTEPNQESVSSLVAPQFFIVEGLALWGVTDETTVDIRFHNLILFRNPVPALAFANGLDFEEIRQGLELEPPMVKNVPEKVVERLHAAMRWRDLLQARGGRRPFYPSVEEASVVELRFKGPISAAMFWGLEGNPKRIKL